MVKVVAASGYFDPLHVGHIEYLENSEFESFNPLEDITQVDIEKNK